MASAERKLRAIFNAVELRDLRSPPGNRLEALELETAASQIGKELDCIEPFTRAA